MNQSQLKTHIAAAVAMRWDDFAVRHPRVARVIDQHLLVESATQALNVDPDYQRSIANARAVNASSEVVVRIIDRFVTKFIDALV